MWVNFKVDLVAAAFHLAATGFISLFLLRNGRTRGRRQGAAAQPIQFKLFLGIISFFLYQDVNKVYNYITNICSILSHEYIFIFLHAQLHAFMLSYMYAYFHILKIVSYFTCFTDQYRIPKFQLNRLFHMNLISKFAYY